jgi:DNA-binding NarL/FixJ family response regulator
MDPSPTLCSVVVVDRLRLDRDLLVHAVAHAEGFAVAHAMATLVGARPDGAADAVAIRATAPGPDLPAEVAAAVALPGRPRVVVLAGYVDGYLAETLRRAGADAVASSAEPLDVVLDLLRGAPVGPTPPDDPTAPGPHHLTPREAQVLDLLADGRPPGEIAHLLDLRMSTVRDHVKSLRTKLGCNSATQLVVTAHRLGLVPHLGRPLR